MKLAFLKTLPQTLGMVLLILSMFVLLATLRSSPITKDNVAHILVGFAIFTAFIGAALGAMSLALHGRPGKYRESLAKHYAVGSGAYLLISATIVVANWSIGAQ